MLTKDDTRQVEEDFDVEKARQEDSAGVQDYMDEEELIEDLGEPAEEDNADQAIIEAELEDYDAEEEEEPIGQEAKPMDIVGPRHLSELEGKDQETKARILGIQLPVLGKSNSGEAFLGFTNLFKSLVVGVPSQREGPVKDSASVGQRRKVHMLTDVKPEMDQENILLASEKELESSRFSIFLRTSEDVYEEPETHEDVAEISEGYEAIIEEKDEEPKQHAASQLQEEHREKSKKTAPVKYMKEARESDYLFPNIPDYVYEPIYQRTWTNMSLRHAWTEPWNTDGPAEEIDSDIEIAPCRDSEEQSMDYDMIQASLSSKGKKVKSWNKPKHDREAMEKDERPSRVGANDILGVAPVLRGIIHPKEKEDQNLVLPENLPKCTAWKEMPADHIVYDMNDPNLVFIEEQPGVSKEQLFQRSNALIMKYENTKDEIQELNAIEDPKILMEAINVSKDSTYFAPPKRKGTGRVGRPVYHSKFATLLHTIPLDLSETQAINWHRPRAAFAPIEKKNVRQQSKDIRVTIWTLFPRQSQRSWTVEDPENTKIESLWDNMISNPTFRDAAELDKDFKPRFYIPGNPPVRVPSEANLLDPIFERKSNVGIGLVAIFTSLDWFKTKEAEQVPEESSTALLRPPFAFSTRKELKAGQCGKIFLMEYMEEYPSLLNHPGMGARLTTYYKKKNQSDITHLKIRDEAEKKGIRWQVGTVVGLAEDDESPFLGQIPAGRQQLALETGIYTSPAHYYQTNSSDFLITRSNSGVMRIREVTGTFICGQELPLHRIPPPNTRSLKNLQESRIHVYVMRTLRNEMARIEKNKTQAVLEGKPINNDEVPYVSLLRTAQMFKGRPINMIRMYFKECKLRYYCKVGEDELYVLGEGARIPTEAELKKMVSFAVIKTICATSRFHYFLSCTQVSPEDACVTEATFAAQVRLKQRGIYNNEAFGGVVPEKLRLAAEMLPDDPETQMAAKALEHALQTAAWSLSDAFMTSFREGRATMRLHGPGDPTGRGTGYSFIRDIRHKSASFDDSKQTIKQKGSKVQGTDADLRRMTTDQAKQKLMEFGLDESEIEPLARWTRIDLVRQLANASVADGAMLGVGKFVRQQKTTIVELQKRYRERAQEIFLKQIDFLNDTAGDDLGAQDDLEAELQAELEDASDEEMETSKKVRLIGQCFTGVQWRYRITFIILAGKRQKRIFSLCPR